MSAWMEVSVGARVSLEGGWSGRGARRGEGRLDRMMRLCRYQQSGGTDAVGSWVRQAGVRQGAVRQGEAGCGAAGVRQGAVRQGEAGCGAAGVRQDACGGLGLRSGEEISQGYGPWAKDQPASWLSSLTRSTYRLSTDMIAPKRMRSFGGVAACCSHSPAQHASGSLLTPLAWLAGWVALGLLANLVTTSAVPFNPSQVKFLNDTKSWWSDPPSDCDHVYGLKCDVDGMITEINRAQSELTGIIPSSIGALTRLTYMALYNNSLTGSIPAQIGSLKKTLQVHLFANQLTGSIPASIGSMSDLTLLDLSRNQLSGSIPASFSELQKLGYIYLYTNDLTGSIPSNLGSLTNLEAVGFNVNNLAGSIPDSLMSLAKLTYLNLSMNSLSGTIPSTVGNMRHLLKLHLHDNNLSGPIPTSIGDSLLYLEELNLFNNDFSGAIPPSIGNLFDLQTFTTWGTSLTCPVDYTSCVQQQIAETAFCRKCPSFCTTCLELTAAPPAPSPNSSSISQYDSATSGGASGLSLGGIIGIVVAGGGGAAAAAAAAVLRYLRHKRQQKATDIPLASMAGSWAALHSTEFSLAEVEAATNNWAAANQLGSGAFGDVFKGVSPLDGVTEWAVKRAKLLHVDFQREVQQMADKNHPNIVRLLGFAVGGDMRTRPEQVLIYEFEPNGDLEKWLNSTKAPFSLTLPQWLGILIGAARGLEYLHSFDFVHRDIKPANILVSADMQAKIADFGLVRMGEGTTVGSTRVMGTPGYVDPVYSRTNKATTATDVYSFGVLILVVLTGRSPIAEAGGERTHILHWVEDCLAKGSDLSCLKNPCVDVSEEVLLRLTQLAVSCTVGRTASRPTMGDIANELQAIRNEVAGKEEVSAAVKVDEEVVERLSVFRNLKTLDEEIDLIGMIA
ncbi:unnamed protein product [Closterium sp. Yama58-4]|nr:unnamed protein product [Closterium sp. Yama58-4]